MVAAVQVMHHLAGRELLNSLLRFGAASTVGFHSGAPIAVRDYLSKAGLRYLSIAELEQIQSEEEKG